MDILPCASLQAYNLTGGDVIEKSMLASFSEAVSCLSNALIQDCTPLPCSPDLLKALLNNGQTTKDQKDHDPIAEVGSSNGRQEDDATVFHMHTTPFTRHPHSEFEDAHMGRNPEARTDQTQAGLVS